MWYTSRGRRTLQGAEAELVASAVDLMIDQLSIDVDETGLEATEGIYYSGVPLFDSLTTPQQIASLHSVACHLLTDTPPVADPSAAAEATIAAIFACIRDMIATEIDWHADPELASMLDPDLPGFSWRRQVLAAFEAVQGIEWIDEPQPEGLQAEGMETEGLETERREAEGLEADSLRAPFDPLSECDRFWEPEPGEDDESFELPAETSTDLECWSLCVEQLADAILWDRDFEMAEDFLDADPRVSRRRRQLLGIRDDYFTRVAPDPRPSELPELIDATRALVRAKPR